MSSNQPPPKRAVARDRIKAMQAKQAAQEKRRKTTGRAIAAVAVLAVAGAVGVFWQQKRAEVETKHAAKAVTRTVEGIQVGNAGPQVDIFEDFQCPHCRTFEAQIGETLINLANAGKAKVVFHPVAFIDGAPGATGESARASNAAFCSADYGKFGQYHAMLFNKQPGENTGFFSNDKLLELGKEVGLTDPKFAECVTKNSYSAAVRQVTEKTAPAYQVSGTPAMYIQGRKVGPAGSAQQGELPPEIDANTFDPVSVTKAITDYANQPFKKPAPPKKAPAPATAPKP